MKDPNKQKAKETVASIVKLTERAKDLQKRLDELDDHINTLEAVLDELGGEFDEQIEFLNHLNSLKK
jgi:peptidoglycan hydrolase CwlO-like protein|tara:strand:- start:338 stop:538 length:201 start_codon:yes stop_codon:yes gene_type:complete